MKDEIYYKVYIYFLNGSFTQFDKIFYNCEEADEVARNKANNKSVKCTKLFQYINGNKILLSTIYRQCAN